MIAGVLRETCPGEKRVALVPTVVPSLTKAGVQVLIESGAGDAAGFPDAGYKDKGAEIVASRDEILAKADCVLQVRTFGANPDAGRGDLDKLRANQWVIGHGDPLAAPDRMSELASRGVSTFALELVPRITRAQAMDVLSSQANIAGYKAVLIAAEAVPRMFPMMMTAAGTVTPAKVFVIGAGVAGLQAIATARRLGAVVEGYDVRPAVKEQVMSLGAKFLEIPLDTASAEGSGGYAKALGEEFYKRQRELMGKSIAVSDVVICTAAVPGGKAPVLVTAEQVKAMSPGSVIVDLAAERGGNCELTQSGKTVIEHGVTIVGTLNLPATVAYHASQLYAKNIVTFLLHVVKTSGGDAKAGALPVPREDEIVRETLTTFGGEVVHARLREMLKLPALAAPAAEAPAKTA